MVRRPLRIAVTAQLERSAREAGYDVYLLPTLPDADFNRTISQRISDGSIYRPFLEKHDIDLVLDFNTEALTFLAVEGRTDKLSLTTAALGIPYVACYLDPVTSTMSQVSWADHWHLLESANWIKWVWETAHAEELMKLGIPNVIAMPMAATNDDFDTSPPPEPDVGPLVAFMGHPASSWFSTNQAIGSGLLFPGLTAAAVHADMPDLPFHRVYFELYGFAAPPSPKDERIHRAEISRQYFDHKFIYNAYLAIRQRDRFARFLKNRLGDAFELIGDHWGTTYGLPHTPRIWDMKELHARMRRVPICLNLMKGCLESGLNIRHFEITSHGGFMLTYATPELANCFEIGKECDVFRDESELLTKIEYYVNHPKQRKEIAVAGQRRTLSQHLYSHRIQQLVNLLTKSNVLPKPGVAAADSNRQTPVSTKINVSKSTATDALVIPELANSVP